MRIASPLFAATLLISCSHENDLPDLDRFQTSEPEIGLTRGPDGWYVSRLDGTFGSDARSRIFRYNFDGGGGERVPFFAKFADVSDLNFDRVTGKALFVVANDIWMADWNDQAGWHNPTAVTAVNTPGYEGSPQWIDAGSFYFSSVRDDGMGQGDIYLARQAADGWHIEPLGAAINSPTGEWNLAISADRTALVFEASSRETNRTVSGDLYLSCKQDGEWQPAVPMDRLNTDGSDLNFQFTGARSGVFVSAEVGGDARLRYAGQDNFTPCLGHAR
ncbi:MAG: hypothetical protein EP341_08950 [Sphingomonadales bacterium]|nr:MAG: hypothetical protein EP341_08950 [Sphingomonadales bacterium]